MASSQDFINALAKAAAENPKLKEKLIKNPRAVIEATLNTKLPENFEVNILEDTPQKLNLVLPPQAGELSEFDLTAVTGGLGSLDLLNDRLNLLLLDENLL